ncbi:MAG: hypothetical protein A2053_05570 [Deltaproteobacteria bacterium GWA2_50_8]|nr:MAG: hypothetical protein A2053_05570 [Deltaproteobacteria bacterium GWA2_50_8]
MSQEITGKYDTKAAPPPSLETATYEGSSADLEVGISLITGKPLEMSRFESGPREDRSTREILQGLAPLPYPKT